MASRVVYFSQHGPLCHADVLVLQNFDEAPLAAVTASSLLGYEAKSVLYLWGYFAILLCRSCQALPAWMETNSGETFSFFWSLQRCLMGLSQDSGWGHSRTSLQLPLSYFCVVLAVCLRLLSWLKVKTGFHSNMKLRIDANMFSLGSIRPQNLVYNSLESFRCSKM